jgi:hypothetical protein
LLARSFDEPLVCNKNEQPGRFTVQAQRQSVGRPVRARLMTTLNAGPLGYSPARMALTGISPSEHIAIVREIN